MSLLAPLADYGHDGWDGGWMWVGGTLMMLAFVALVAVVVWAIVRGLGDRPRSPGAGTSARAILDERYARGEIGQDEYRQKLRDLAG